MPSVGPVSQIHTFVWSSTLECRLDPELTNKQGKRDEMLLLRLGYMKTVTFTSLVYLLALSFPISLNPTLGGEAGGKKLPCCEKLMARNGCLWPTASKDLYPGNGHRNGLGSDL